MRQLFERLAELDSACVSLGLFVDAAEKAATTFGDCPAFQKIVRDDLRKLEAGFPSLRSDSAKIIAGGVIARLRKLTRGDGYETQDSSGAA